MSAEAWRLQGDVPPAARQGLFAAIPVGALVLVDIELDLPVSGALATGALLAGFVAFDAPPRARAVWQLLTAPFIGIGAALGALTGETAWLAVLTMLLFASVGGVLVVVSPRAGIAGMTCVLALVIAQGIALRPDQAPIALLLGTAGAAIQTLFALTSSIGVPPEGRVHPIAGTKAALRTIRANLTLRSRGFRHALRWSTALAVGVALYHALQLGEHGYWIPLTTLFVLKPEAGLTWQRIAMRAVGTVSGLAIATPLAMAIGSFPVAEAMAMTVAAGFCFALLAIEYALFTFCITSFVILLAHSLGQSAWQAADQRGIGTALGIAVATAAFVVWSNHPLEKVEAEVAEV
jgi:hypothetical protein